MTRQLFQIVLAIVRDDDKVLMVRQYEDGVAYWVLPGGVVEAGELIGEALAREVREEAGVEVAGLRRLAYVTQIDNRVDDNETVAFAFEVAGWSGAPQPNDPDGLVDAAEWVPLRQARDRLAAVGWRGMREPLRAYLAGTAAPGSVWQYRQDDDGEQRLVERVEDL